MRPTPRQPRNLPEYALKCLETLVDAGLANRIILGGGVGLLHYLDFRPTVDLGAWWVKDSTEEDQNRILEIIERTLNQFGQVKKRAWGDVVSLELLQEGHKNFSFQIDNRSAQ